MKASHELGGSRFWRLLIIVAIIWGCLLRFHALDKNVYWEDEVFTSLRLSGHTEEELVETAFQGEIVYPTDLLEFQITHADKTVGDTVSSLSNDTHPPGYFVLLWLWTRSWMGDPSVASVRALSAIISLLLLPEVFVLAWLLFERSPQRQAIAELSTALVAVSPYQVALANEARMYSLLPVVTTLAGLCLLCAVRSAPISPWPSPRLSTQPLTQLSTQPLTRLLTRLLTRPLTRRYRWGWYGLTSAASLYVHWFAIPMLAGYGLYIWLHRQVSHSLHWARSQKRYLLTTALTAGAVTPWILYMGPRLKNVYTHTQWAGETVKFWGEEESLGQLWLQHGLLLFFNGDIFSQLLLLNQFLLLKWVGGILAIALILCAMIYLTRHTQLSVWSFLLISSGIIYVPLAIADVLLGGRRSGIFRYLAPSLGAIEISVAFCLVSLGGIALLQHQSSDQKTHSLSRRLARGAIVLLLIGGAGSQTLARATYSAEQHPLGNIASIVNQTPGALLVSDAPRPSLVLPLAHLLKAETPLMLTIHPNQPTLNQPTIEKLRDRPVFLYLPSPELQTAIQTQGKRLQLVSGTESLFSLNVESANLESANLESERNSSRVSADLLTHEP